MVGEMVQNSKFRNFTQYTSQNSVSSSTVKGEKLLFNIPDSIALKMADREAKSLFFATVDLLDECGCFRVLVTSI